MHRTRTISLMVVTLDVSKLSSWLNASAFCRESQGGGHAVRGSASGMHGEGLAQPDSRLRPRRARAERTINMLPMFVALDVSKLSSWLNADAPCRVERRA